MTLKDDGGERLRKHIIVDVTEDEIRREVENELIDNEDFQEELLNDVDNMALEQKKEIEGVKDRYKLHEIYIKK